MELQPKNTTQMDKIGLHADKTWSNPHNVHKYAHGNYMRVS